MMNFVFQMQMSEWLRKLQFWFRTEVARAESLEYLLEFRKPPITLDNIVQTELQQARAGFVH